jgi:hypothetical protein
LFGVDLHYFAAEANVLSEERLPISSDKSIASKIFDLLSIEA